MRTTLGMRSADDRYRNDPQFKQLVDQMIAHIMNLDYTPSEMRDAAMLASIHVEMMRPVRHTITRDEFDRMHKSFPELKK